jgi:hypothetical protein
MLDAERFLQDSPQRQVDHFQSAARVNAKVHPGFGFRRPDLTL